MTPGARVAAAIEILDQVGTGTPVEQALTRWARSSRYAGSKDRAAVRDHVYDVMRQWRSAAALGGGDSGRARMIGRLRAAGADLDALFNGQGHAPALLTEAEVDCGAAPDTRGAALDMPDWLLEQFDTSLGTDAERTALALRDRAPVSVRVNIGRGSVEDALHALAEDAVTAHPNPRAATALTLQDGARRLRAAKAYVSGLVELQDAASQAAVALITGQGRVLDFCAGGGGTALALAALALTIRGRGPQWRRFPAGLRAFRASESGVATGLAGSIGALGSFGAATAVGTNPVPGNVRSI